MKVLDQLTALGPDADVWMLPDLEHSDWSQKIDWYLNYQIQRSAPHRPADFSKELVDVIERSDFVAPMVRIDAEAPLMIGCGKLLPAKQAVVIPVRAGEAEWVSSCHRVWIGLGKPSVRIFLPQKVSTAVFSKLWPKQDIDAAIEVLSDEKISVE